MAVELAAVRLLSPWFGTSLVVWTNVLEVILLGLAIGYMVGARLSKSESSGNTLALILLCGAVAAGWTPFIAAPVCEWFLPRGLALHDAAQLLTWGSLAAGLVLFLPAAVVLGTVGPLLVEEIGRSGEEHAGTAGGRVLAASTLGSVLGAFGTSYYALSLPALGVARTFILVALLLLLCSIWTHLQVRRRRVGLVSAAGILLIVPAALFSELRLPVLSDGVRQLAKVESLYQTVRAVEDTRFETTYRYLQVNEGFDSYQSVWSSELGLLGEGFYYDDFVLPLWWTPDAVKWEVLVLGFGAGTVHRVMSGAKPAGVELSMTGVELDKDVIDLGREWFDLPADGKSLTIHSGLDARFALNRLEGPYDQVVLDAYANQVEIPPHLSTLEFFSLVREKLSNGGWAIANVGGFGFDDPVVEAIAETLAVAFQNEVLVLRVPSTRNFTLITRRDAEVPHPDRESWVVGERARLTIGRLLESRELPGGAQLVPAADASAIDRRQERYRDAAASLTSRGSRATSCWDLESFCLDCSASAPGPNPQRSSVQLLHRTPCQLGSPPPVN